MKCIYWNTRGLANYPTRLALKNLILNHNPDIVLLSEPWLNFDDYPRRWFINLDLKLFAMNSRPNMLPNLWCLCKSHLNPTVLVSDVQHVSFIVLDNDKLFGISAIYASINYVTRRKLWESLNLLQTQNVCCLGAS
jgi:hypothetical protein